jgi:hypothetical protein
MTTAGMHDNGGPGCGAILSAAPSPRHSGPGSLTAISTRTTRLLNARYGCLSQRPRGGRDTTHGEFRRKSDYFNPHTLLGARVRHRGRDR